MLLHNYHYYILHVTFGSGPPEVRSLQRQNVKWHFYIYIYIYIYSYIVIYIYIYTGLRHSPLRSWRAAAESVGNARVRANDDRAKCRNAGIPHRKSLCPVVMCPY